MEDIKITPEAVSELYKKLNNKQLFISMFGTTAFSRVSPEFLERMHKYLVQKVAKNK